MLLNRWRVGSLTMGLVLLVLGVMMLISFLTHVSLFGTILVFWPIILICLGAEILLHLFFRRSSGENLNMKYDVLGILFVGCILTVSVFFYALTSSMELLGLSENPQAALGIKTEDVSFEKETELPGTETLVVFGGFQNITIVAAEGGHIRLNFRASANTNDQEYAQAVLEDIVRIESGERTYVLSDAGLYYSNRRISYPFINGVIYLPPEKTVDLSQFSGNYQYDGMLESQIVKSEPEFT